MLYLSHNSASHEAAPYLSSELDILLFITTLIAKDHLNSNLVT